MPDEKIPQIAASEREDSPTTRSEALREALKAGTTPQPPREFSTLVERPEPVDRTPGCADERNCVVHGAAWELEQLVWPPRTVEALMAAIAETQVAPSRSVRAGGADGSGDVVDDEREREPRPAARDERHDGGNEGQD